MKQKTILGLDKGDKLLHLDSNKEKNKIIKK